MQTGLRLVVLAAAECQLHDAILTEDEARILLPLRAQLLQQIVAHICDGEQEHVRVLLHAVADVLDDLLLPLQTLALCFGEGNYTPRERFGTLVWDAFVFILVVFYLLFLSRFDRGMVTVFGAAGDDQKSLKTRAL